MSNITTGAWRCAYCQGMIPHGVENHYEHCPMIANPRKHDLETETALIAEIKELKDKIEAVRKLANNNKHSDFCKTHNIGRKRLFCDEYHMHHDGCLREYSHKETLCNCIIGKLIKILESK